MDPEREDYADPDQPPPAEWLAGVLWPVLIGLGAVASLAASLFLWLASSVPRLD